MTISTQISLNKDDIKKIIAEKYNTDINNVELYYYREDQYGDEYITATVAQ